MNFVLFFLLSYFAGIGTLVVIRSQEDIAGWLWSRFKNLFWAGSEEESLWATLGAITATLIISSAECLLVGGGIALANRYLNMLIPPQQQNVGLPPLNPALQSTFGFFTRTFLVPFGMSRETTSALATRDFDELRAVASGEEIGLICAINQVTFRGANRGLLNNIQSLAEQAFVLMLRSKRDNVDQLKYWDYEVDPLYAPLMERRFGAVPRKFMVVLAVRLNILAAEVDMPKHQLQPLLINRLNIPPIPAAQ